jgi:hypothetical protein
VEEEKEELRAALHDAAAKVVALSALLEDTRKREQELSKMVEDGRGREQRLSDALAVAQAATAAAAQKAQEEMGMKHLRAMK